MNYLFESIFVGIFTCIVYWVVYGTIGNLIHIPIHVLLFVVGFLKHALGYIFLHNLYCKYGSACVSYNRSSAKYTNLLLLECIGEGILYLVYGSVLLHIFHSLSVIFFIIGASLHIMFEQLQVHTWFCSARCY